MVVPDPSSSSSPSPFRLYYYGRSDHWNLGVSPFNASLPTGRIGLAFSPHGLSFDRFLGPLQGGAIFDPSNDPLAFDCVHIGVGDVQFSHEENRWFIYYFGGGLDEVPLPGLGDRSYKGARLQIGMAFSDDGIAFKDRRGPIVGVGAPGSWDENYVAWPRVLQPSRTPEGKKPHDGKWLMSYHTREVGGPKGIGFCSVGIAVSDDGKSWEKIGKVISHGDLGAWDEGGVSVRHIIRHKGQYLMFYEGSSFQFNFSIGLATSEDGLHWKKDTECGPEPGGPLLKPRRGEHFWDNFVVGTPYVIAMPDGTFRMYYIGVGKTEGETTLMQGLGVALSHGSDFRTWKRFES